MAHKPEISDRANPYDGPEELKKMPVDQQLSSSVAGLLHQHQHVAIVITFDGEHTYFRFGAAPWISEKKLARINVLMRQAVAEARAEGLFEAGGEPE